MNAPSPSLPDEFLRHLTELERAYLRETDPIRQSGFGGGPARWHAERSPILEAIPESTELLDVGCANGYLLECLMQWGAERGLVLTPYGLDCSAHLIALARRRLPRYADHFYTGNAWDWDPPRTFFCVYSLWDCVPRDYFDQYVTRLLKRVVTPGGTLIIGAYGSRSRAEAPVPIDLMLADLGHTVVGSASGGVPELTRFAWVRAASRD